MEIGSTVAAHERLKPNARRRIPIPDVCLAMGLSLLDTFDMMRSTRAILHLKPTPSDDTGRDTLTNPGLESRRRGRYPDNRRRTAQVSAHHRLGFPSEFLNSVRPRWRQRS
ncbi:DUF4411 family protein [Brachybacterium tyrofermentans]|uniref:DUF4411 family protein n=1 Tax=Brachybacterium tyrofermentans TaxID=47848 RepID=UPI003FCFE346